MKSPSGNGVYISFYISMRRPIESYKKGFHKAAEYKISTILHSPKGKLHTKQYCFYIDYQTITKYLKKFLGKRLSVSEKAVFLQPQTEQVL